MASRDYPEDVVLKAMELAAAIGFRPAGRELAIPHDTIWRWTRDPSYSAIWAEYRRQNAPRWRERTAVSLEDLVDRYTEKLDKAVDKADGALETMEPRDLANYIRSIAVAQGVAADHVAKLRGQPTQIHAHVVDASQLEQAMAQLALEAAKSDVDSTATELPADTQADE